MKLWLKAFKEDARGLTLVELLAVIVILAIVSIIATVSVGNIIDNTKKDAHITNALSIISAAKLYEASGGDVSSGVTVETLYSEQLLEPLIDPWNKTPYGADARVEFGTLGDTTTPVYYIDGFSVENCTFEFATGVSEDSLLKEGRDLCIE